MTMASTGMTFLLVFVGMMLPDFVGSFTLTPSVLPTKSCSASMTFKSVWSAGRTHLLRQPPSHNRGFTRSVFSLSMAAGYTIEKLEDVESGSKYRFKVDVPSELVKTTYTKVMKDFKKNAKFPGFRVGTIPPFMLPQVKSFVILECLERTLKDAVDTEGLELSNSEKKPTLDDAQVEQLTKSFKETEGFTYSIEGVFKSKTSEAAPPA